MFASTGNQSKIKKDSHTLTTNLNLLPIPKQQLKGYESAHRMHQDLVCLPPALQLKWLKELFSTLTVHSKTPAL